LIVIADHQGKHHVKAEHFAFARRKQTITCICGRITKNSAGKRAAVKGDTGFHPSCIGTIGDVRFDGEHKLVRQPLAIVGDHGGRHRITEWERTGIRDRQRFRHLIARCHVGVGDQRRHRLRADDERACLE
jgi:hypothetical protein